MVLLRKVYSQVFGMLILSTIILIFTLGWGVFSQLSWQLTRDGQAALQAEVSEVQYSISESHGGQQALAVSSLTDDRGKNIYFIVLHNGHVFIKTMNPIVPVQKVESFSKSKGFKIFQYQGLPYRVLSATVNENNSVY